MSKYLMHYNSILYIVLFLALFTFSNTFGAYKCLLSNQDRLYAEIRVSEYINMASNKQSKIAFRPYGTQLNFFNFISQDMRMKRSGVYIGGGYQWRLSKIWSWSLGGRLSYYSLRQKGYSMILENNLEPYRYNTHARFASVLLRLNWQTSLYNVLYFETQAGIARLSSNGFRLTSGNESSSNKKKTTNNFTYEVGVGWTHLINEHIGLSISVGYQDFGTALLGTQVVPAGAVSHGDVKQKMHGIVNRAGLSYYF